MKKTKIALGVATASLTLAGAMVSPQAAALTQTEANSKKTAALESQVNEMATMMHAMQAELTRVKDMTSDSVDTAKVQELDQWMSSVKNAPVHEAAKDQMFSVRGGWMHMDNSRGATDSVAGTGIGTDLLTSDVDEDAFYYGGAIDFNMNNDLFGLMDGVSFGIELGIEYSELSERETNGLGVVLGVSNLQQTVTVNMLRVSAAPKIRFMHGSKLRPWIIPVGLDFNIISPPSDAVTVLNTGMQFGAGVDYELFPNIVTGVDARYHYTPDDLDGITTDGFTLGGSVGFKF
ncbi:MAG: hypothetical protein ACKE51_03630 [Methylococcaceae bacterium]